MDRHMRWVWLLFVCQAVYGAKPLKTIEIVEDAQLDFGKVPAENGTCRMSSGGGLTGLGGNTCTGIGTMGVFSVSGSNNQLINISVLGGESGGARFEPLIDGSLIVTLSSKTTVTIIGDLVVTNATAGQKQILYTVSVNYE